MKFRKNNGAWNSPNLKGIDRGRQRNGGRPLTPLFPGFNSRMRPSKNWYPRNAMQNEMETDQRWETCSLKIGVAWFALARILIDGDDTNSYTRLGIVGRERPACMLTTTVFIHRNSSSKFIIFRVTAVEALTGTNLCMTPGAPIVYGRYTETLEAGIWVKFPNLLAHFYISYCREMLGSEYDVIFYFNFFQIRQTVDR